MPKKRERNSDEFYRARIRELEKEIRSLQKRVKELEKFERAQDEEVITDTEDTYIELPKLNRCLDCGKGFMEEFELMGKVYGTCNICGNRKRIK